MRSKLIFFIITLSLSSANCATSSDQAEVKPADLSIKELIEEIGSKTEKLGDAKKTIRLAVVAFVSTRRDRYPGNEFGEYITENLITSIKRDHARIRLFERRRLEAILNENSLAMSGLIGRDEAKKIGELAPVDYLITGSYTVLKNSVEINGRAIDVLSGEIVFAFRRKLPLRELEGFFREREVAPRADTDSEKSPCPGKWSGVRERLADLSSGEKIQSLVDYAIGIPFDTECGKIHFDVLYRFIEHKIYNQVYSAFLRKTLHSIKVPIEDFRAATIMRYFHLAGPLDEDTWKACLGIIRRSPGRYMSQYIRLSFHEKGLDAAGIDVQKRRIDQFFDLAADGKIGLPVPIGFTAAFNEMIEALIHGSREDVILPFYCFERYLGRSESSNEVGVHSKLLTLYRRDADPARREIILKWICGNFNRAAPNENIAREMILFVKFMRREISGPGRGEKEKKELRRHLETFKASCAKQLEATLPIVRHPNEKRDRIVFCIQNNIRCSIVPDIEELKKKLESEDAGTVKETLSLISEMEEGASPFEGEIVALLAKANKKKIANSASIKLSCIRILGNIRTHDAKALEAVVMAILRGGSSVYAESARIGGPLVPYLVKILRGNDYYDKSSAVRVLNLMGSAAKSALPDLKAEMGRTRSGALREQIREAVMRIE